MKKPCDILKDFLYRFYAKRIPYEQRLDALVRFYSNYTSAPIFDSMMKKLSLIHNDQKPEFAESWFSQKLIHDEVYKIFSWFNNSEYMLLDIGANAGYSVSSMYSAGARCPIFSFEANEMHRSNLEWIRQKIAYKYEFNYDYAIIGLSDKAGQAKFTVPVINRAAISALATASWNDSLYQLISSHIENYYSDQDIYFSIMEFKVFLDTLDSYIAKNPSKFPLPVAAIKIDTEGMEYNVLQGSINTISKYRPLIVCEGDSPQLREFFTGQGYKEATACEGKLYFEREYEVQPYNKVCVHESYIDHYRNIGLLYS